jgi:hypothetical protein
MATTAQDIFSAFGFSLNRSNGKWIARPFGEEHPFAESNSLRQLIESIVPPPPIYGGSETMEEWAYECVAASRSRAINPVKLAKAAFAAYQIKYSNKDVERFAKACKKMIRQRR